MKTIQKNEQIKRVKDVDAEFLVKNQGWKYCSKSLWKSTEDTPKVVSKEEVVEEVIGENLSDKKVRKMRKDNKRKKYAQK
jgi:hypothetical protein